MQRIDLISDELTEQLNSARKDFVWFLVLDESTDNQDAAVIFIHGINKKFVITEELLCLESMKNTITGQDLFQCVVDCVKKNAVSHNGKHNYGARAFTEKNVSMIKLLCLRSWRQSIEM